MTAKRSASKRKQPAAGILPRYAPDDGPLSDGQMAAIRKLVPQRGFVSHKKRLF